MKFEFQEGEEEQLWEALLDAYQTENDLKRMVKFKLKENLETIVKKGSLEDMIFDLIELSVSEGKIEQLIQGSYQYKDKSNNDKLNEFYQEIYLVKSPFTSEAIKTLEEEEWESLKGILAEIDYDILQENCSKTLESEVEKLEDHVPEILVFRNIKVIHEILLEKYPLRKKDAVPTILEFVQRLRDDQRCRSYHKKLEKWLKERVKQKKGLSYPIDYIRPKRKSVQGTRIIESYLLIEIEIDPQDREKVFLKSQLIPDYSIQATSEVIQRIDISIKEQAASWGEIAMQISQLIGQAKCRLIKEDNPYNLTIELFVPLNYLGEKFDLEKIAIGLNDYKCIANEYRFTLRCSERYDLTLSGNYGDYLNRLRIVWERFHEWLKESPQSEHLKNYCVYLEQLEEGYNWQEQQTKWYDSAKFVVSLTRGVQEAEEQQEFFKSLLRAGIPLSLWNRCTEFECELVKGQLNQVLTLDNLQNLSQLLDKIHKLRQKAHSKGEKNSKKHLGYHLGVISEHPKRLPSWYDYSQGGDMLESYD